MRLRKPNEKGFKFKNRMSAPEDIFRTVLSPTSHYNNPKAVCRQPYKLQDI